MRLANTLTILLTTAALTIGAGASAQTVTDTTMMVAPTDEDTTITVAPSEHEVGMEMGRGGPDVSPIRKWYWSGGFDAALFQTSWFRRPDHNDELTYLRFSYFVNLSFDFNYDFDNNFGMFTGLGIKNIGLTQKDGDSTIKRRVYTLGVPLGFKIGNLERNRFVLIGGGIDVPLNYREKGWKDRDHKTKMNEWFSDRTADYMPYLFVGASFKKSLTLKLQYYPSNFFNIDYEQVNADGRTVKPFAGFDARLIYLSVGMNIHYKGKGHGSKKDEVKPVE